MRDPGPAYLRIAAARRFFEGVRWPVEDFAPVEVETAAEAQSEEGDGTALGVWAICGRRTAILYASAPDRQADDAREAQAVTFRIPSFTPGACTLEAWDPAKGKLLYRAATVADAEALSIRVPEFTGEIALKVESFDAALPSGPTSSERKTRGGK